MTKLFHSVLDDDDDAAAADDDDDDDDDDSSRRQGISEYSELSMSRASFPPFYCYLISTRLFRNLTTRSFFQLSPGTICRIG